MSMEIFQKVREMGKELKKKRKNEEIDYNYIPGSGLKFKI